MARIKVWQDEGIAVLSGASPTAVSCNTLDSTTSEHQRGLSILKIKQSTANVLSPKPLIANRPGGTYAADLSSQVEDGAYQDRSGVKNLNQTQQLLLLKQVKDVAAAERFRDKLEKINNLSNSHIIPQSHVPSEKHEKIALVKMFSFDNRPGITKSRLTSARDSQSVMQRKKATSQHRPVALQLSGDSSLLPLQVRSAGLLPESVMQQKMTLDGLQQPAVPALQRRRTVADFQHDQAKMKKSRRLVNVYQRDDGVPPLPSTWAARVEQARSKMVPTSLDLSSNLSSSTMMFMSDVHLTNSAHSLQTHTQVPTSAISVQHPEQPLTENMVGRPPETIDEILENIKPFIVPPSVAPTSISTAELKRKRSLFRWLHRRSELDELIDLYMDDVQTDMSVYKKKPDRPRRIALWPIRNITDPLPSKPGLRLLTGSV